MKTESERGSLVLKLTCNTKYIFLKHSRKSKQDELSVIVESNLIRKERHIVLSEAYHLTAVKLCWTFRN